MIGKRHKEGSAPRPDAGDDERSSSVLRFTMGAAVASLLILALVFSVTYGTRLVTSSAHQLGLINEILRPATVARAQIALAVNMAAQDREFGTNSSDGVAFAVAEAKAALEQVETGLFLLSTEDISPDVLAVTDAFVATSRAVLEELESSNSVGAQIIADSALDADFNHFLDTVVASRDATASVIASSDAWLGRVGDWSRFAVAFIVPSLILMIYRELSRRRERQHDLELSLAAERALSKSRDEFIANASHELRTPLTSIYGLALILEEDEAVSGSDTASELLNLMIAESVDLNRIVEDLLTSARLDAGELRYILEDFDVPSEVADLTAVLSRAGVAVEASCDDGVIHVDPLRTRQLLRNLLSNASKYGGDRVRVAGKRDGHDYVIVVEDDGDGVDPEIEDKLFERFVRQGDVATAMGSVGLGLSIVRALASDQGGSVTYSRQDGWTRFTVRLPLATDSAFPDDGVAAQASSRVAVPVGAAGEGSPS